MALVMFLEKNNDYFTINRSYLVLRRRVVESESVIVLVAKSGPQSSRQQLSDQATYAMVTYPCSYSPKYIFFGHVLGV